MRNKGSKTSKIRYKLELYNVITKRPMHTQLFSKLSDIADILDMNYQQVQAIKYGKNKKMEKYIKITLL